MLCYSPQYSVIKHVLRHPHLPSPGIEDSSNPFSKDPFYYGPWSWSPLVSSKKFNFFFFKRFVSSVTHDVLIYKFPYFVRFSKSRFIQFYSGLLSLFGPLPLGLTMWILVLALSCPQRPTLSPSSKIAVSTGNQREDQIKTLINVSSRNYIWKQLKFRCIFLVSLTIAVTLFVIYFLRPCERSKEVLILINGIDKNRDSGKSIP